MTDSQFNPKETTDTFETILFVGLTKQLIEKSEPSKIRPALEEVARREKYNLADDIDSKIANIVLLQYVLKN